jgi:chromosome segregation ATPase
MQNDGTPQGQEKSQERYVEELAGPDDYWLTITDAARATRRQDVSIRRWISKGLLPVRRQHVGLNQRTRLVRASDLAVLTPIIDPAGAISSERGRLDLTSIPTQQAQIKASQQHILTQIEDLQSRLSKEAEAMQQALAEQATRQQEALASLRDTIFQRQREELAQQRKEVDIMHAHQQAEFERKIRAQETQIATTLNRLAELSRKIETLTEVWQRNAEQYQQQFDMLTTHLQQEVQARQGLTLQVEQLFGHLAELQVRHEHEVQTRTYLAERVEQLSRQLIEQESRHEQEVEARIQLSQQVEQLSLQMVEMTGQAARQQTLSEHEAQAREQLARHVTQLSTELTEQQAMHEASQQQLLTLLSQQEAALAALQGRFNGRRRDYDSLTESYVKLKEQVSMLAGRLDNATGQNMELG